MAVTLADLQNLTPFHTDTTEEEVNEFYILHPELIRVNYNRRTTKTVVINEGLLPRSLS